MLITFAGHLLQASAAAGDLDLTFGGTGKVTTNFLDNYDGAEAVAIQTDGKIVVAGYASSGTDIHERIALARYMPDGTLDATFGVGGLVMSEFGSVGDIAIQNDGKIVVAGHTPGSGGPEIDILLVRYNADGSLDATFGVSGIVITDFSGAFDSANGIALQPDGKIVIAGTTHALGEPTDFAVARYLSNGDLDASFGMGGKVAVDFNDTSDIGKDVALQADGKIVAVGRADNSNFGVVRLLANGSIDLAFGTNGRTMVDFVGGLDEANAVALQTDGKIVAAGRAGYAGINSDFGVVRLTTDGGLDATFGVGGKVTTNFVDFGETVNDILIQPDGRIVAAGLVTIWVDLSSGDIDFGLARYNPDGSLDATFGVGGKVTTPVTDSEAAQAVALQADCKIVAAGFTNPSNTSDSMFGVVRYDAGSCSTPTVCPKPQGFWKNNSSLWPVQSLTLGNETYTKSELLSILNNSGSGDASVTLAKQLIAAKLNIENGADTAPASAAVTNGDNALTGFSGKLPYKVKPKSSTGQNMVSIGITLDNYNNGVLTDGCSL